MLIALGSTVQCAVTIRLGWFNEWGVFFFKSDFIQRDNKMPQGDLTLDMTGLHNRVKEFPAHSVENVEEIDLVVQHSTYRVIHIFWVDSKPFL